jgi:hypothetical protein
VQGAFEATGHAPAFIDELSSRGIELDRACFTAGPLAQGTGG